MWINPGRAVVSLVSEDLATSPELAERALAAGAGLQAAAGPRGSRRAHVRLVAEEDQLADAGGGAP